VFIPSCKAVNQSAQPGFDYFCVFELLYWKDEVNNVSAGRSARGVASTAICCPRCQSADKAAEYHHSAAGRLFSVDLAARIWRSYFE
jgi:hypothetical protein